MPWNKALKYPCLRLSAHRAEMRRGVRTDNQTGLNTSNCITQGQGNNYEASVREFKVQSSKLVLNEVKDLVPRSKDPSKFRTGEAPALNLGQLHHSAPSSTLDQRMRVQMRRGALVRIVTNSSAPVG